ncbi:hypothetical protein QBC36DRAFT_286407 [Triangularia setosa]|uniref:Uncharacterized protein n=1 Tax=Triangularia setosa TaxID=2587417 RepID=A0AAN6WFC3_9PEZI|nr:hypothetical protein QBC36DRAFT_286407 [Podospora setosa]
MDTGFPLNYAHQLGWRCPIPAEQLKHIPNLDNFKDIEFMERVFNKPFVLGETVSWGVKVFNERMFSRFNRNWTEFAAYAGPAMESLVAWDKLVLVSDSSHPSTGGFFFGSVSTFAMEDSWTPARSIEYAQKVSTTGSVPIALSEALLILNTIRKSYYRRI